jgi:hypothetical protein
MLDVYRQVNLSELTFKPAHDGTLGLVQLQLHAPRTS